MLVVDVSLVEDGRMKEAEEMKLRLEQQQRDRLRPFTDGKAVYTPRWFMSVTPLVYLMHHDFTN